MTDDRSQENKGDPEFPVDHSSTDIKEVTKIYLEKRKDFVSLSKRTNRISMGSSGIDATDFRMFYPSVLFTRIAVVSRSIQKLLPLPQPGETWDFGSLASIVRNLVEAVITYHWLCGGKVLDSVREGRFILLCLNDYGKRKQIFGERFQDTANAFEDLKQKFESNTYIATLSDKQKKEALKGQKTPFNHDEVLKEIGHDPDGFRFFYRFLSQHTHTGPVSYFRMAENEVGLGVETRLEKAYAISTLLIAMSFLMHAIEEHLEIFPDAEKAKPALTEKDIRRNVEFENGRQLFAKRSRSRTR